MCSRHQYLCIPEFNNFLSYSLSLVDCRKEIVSELGVKLEVNKEVDKRVDGVCNVDSREENEEEIVELPTQFVSRLDYLVQVCKYSWRCEDHVDEDNNQTLLHNQRLSRIFLLLQWVFSIGIAVFTTPMLFFILVLRIFCEIEAGQKETLTSVWVS